MAFDVPRLDPRTHDDLFREMVALIPRYAPEWTDRSESDPGMTLLSLFAWMGEALLYQVNRVPDRSHRELLRLLGLEPRPALPARAWLTFGAGAERKEPLSVPAGTRCEVESPGDDGPVYFETDEELLVLPIALRSVQSFDGVEYVLETPANDLGLEAWFPFGPRVVEGSALYLGFETPGRFPRASLRLAVFPAGGAESSGEGACGHAPGPGHLADALAWEAWDGKTWASVRVLRDDSRGLTGGGNLLFAEVGELARGKAGIETADLYWFRARVVRPDYDAAPSVARLVPNTLEATQAVTVREEVLGSSDGTPEQCFRLQHAPVLAGTLSLDVDEGRGWERWEEKSSLGGSQRGERHFTLHRLKGEVRFGDGKHGRIPATGRNNVRAASYRYGGGPRGNVPAGRVTRISTPVPGLDTVTNLFPAHGGAEEEGLEALRARAPGILRAGDRAVTAADFEELARGTPGVRILRARALPLRHPRHPGVEFPGAVTVVAVPDARGSSPKPSRATLEAVQRHLEEHRLITTEVHVVGPGYHVAQVRAQVEARADADPGRIQADLEAALATWFHPLRGGPEGKGWPFGGAVHPAEAYRVLLGHPGVRRVLEAHVLVDGERCALDGQVAIPAADLVTSGDHEVTVVAR
ncbi:MAG: putative baseplate assembly protein [Planctomycetes bacterium]|nr:putative baseplate assembly protein [Planctomycetota bacterium]